MSTYDLSHLTQPDPQVLIGPIQDDEALFLYAVVRGVRCDRILEVGGYEGYSARNFLAAMSERGVLYTVELSPMASVAPNHRVITKDCALVNAADVGGLPLDLVFYDAHVYGAQMDMHFQLVRQGIITDATIIALHDTNLHPRQVLDFAYPVEGGWVHQPVERRMVNDFKRMNYSAFSLHPPLSRHDEEFPMRHGLTVLQKHQDLKI